VTPADALRQVRALRGGRTAVGGRPEPDRTRAAAC